MWRYGFPQETWNVQILSRSIRGPGHDNDGDLASQGARRELVANHVAGNLRKIEIQNHEVRSVHLLQQQRFEAVASFKYAVSVESQ